MMLRLIVVASLFWSASGAQGAQISWTTWSSTSAGAISTANGPVSMAYAGAAFGVSANYPSYTPAATWADGSIVANGPTPANGSLQLTGGTANLQTLTFTPAVVDPVIAIWSLGSPLISASFVFQNATPIFVCGGANAEYGGSSINVTGNTVSGVEGNGVVQFKGTFTSLSWTNPSAEGWYGFNVGIAGIASVWTDLGSGLGGSSGIPTLVGIGTLLDGSSGALVLTSANRSSPALLCMSVVGTPVPFMGGTLVPFPVALSFVLPTDATGSIVLPFIWRPGHAGLTFYAQYAIQDGSAIQGVSLSNALRGDAP